MFLAPPYMQSTLQETARLILLLSLILLGGVLAAAQPKPKLSPPDFIERGPLSFTKMNKAFDVKANLDINGQPYERIAWKNAAGKFRYKLDNDGSVLEGDIRDVSLNGIRNVPDAAGLNQGTLRLDKVSFTLILTKPVVLPAYGGAIQLAIGREVMVSNPEPIEIKGPSLVNQSGLLSIFTWNQIDWINANFQFNDLPVPIVLNLVAPFGKEQRKDFELPLSTAKLRIINGRFDCKPPPGTEKRVFKIVSTNYRAILQNLQFEDVVAQFSNQRLHFQANKLSATSDFTGKVTKSSSIPVLFRGSGKLARLTGTAPFSAEAAQMDEVKFNGLVSRRAAQSAMGQLSKLAKSTLLQNMSRPFYPVSFVTGVDLDPSFFRVADNPASATQTNSLECVETTTDQVQAIKALGMKTLSDRQKAGIAASSKTLNNLNAPNFLINFPADDLFPLVTAVLKDRLKMDLAGIKIGKQEFLLCAGLPSAKIDPVVPPIKIAYLITPSIEMRKISDGGTTRDTQVLVLRYQIGQSEIDDTVGGNDDENSPDGLVDSISSQLGDADDDTRAPDAEYLVPLSLGYVKEIDLNRTFTEPKTGGKFDLRSAKNELSISIPPDKAVLFIDEKGIHVIGMVEMK